MREKGSDGFSGDYWSKNYSEPESMDGLANAKEHAAYIKSFFELELVDISSVIDFGFGYGNLFEETIKVFMPYRATGIEPSKYVFDLFKNRYQVPVNSMKLMLKNTDLVSWINKRTERSKFFDLGICTSVFQYLTDEEIDIVLPRLSESVKYMYFSVPTDIELERQVSELDFYDEYAIRRSKEFYREKLSPFFKVIGSRFLESKKHFDEETTSFTDYLFRYD
jgi:hypothetical protein